MPLAGKSVVVTGGAVGFGRYVALGCAERGANVTIADIDGEALEEVASQAGVHGHGVVARRTDVREEDQVSALMKAAVASFGGIDYLVNNAAIVPHFQWGVPHWPRVRDMDYEFWSKVCTTNIDGVMLCTKHALAAMESQRSGHIVNLYGGAQTSPPGGLAYMMTKDAVRTFTRFVAEEVREFNVCVLCMAPGVTFAHERAPQEVRDRMPGPEGSGDRFFLAIDAPMELSGQLVTLGEGELVART